MANVDSENSTIEEEEAPIFTVGRLKQIIAEHGLTDEDHIIIGFQVPDEEDDDEEIEEGEVGVGEEEEDNESEEDEGNIDIYAVDFHDVSTDPSGSGRKALLLGADLSDTDDEEEDDDEE